MTQQGFAQTMAARAYFAELTAARSLGFDGVSAYTSAFRIMDETYAAVLDTFDRPIITLGVRTVCNAVA